MSPRPLRRPLVAVGTIAALGLAAAAPAVSAASTPSAPAPAPVSDRLLGGGLLGGLLGGVTAPVAGILQPLLGATGGLPSVLPTTAVSTLTDALTGVTQSLAPTDVSSLLGALSPTQLQQVAETAGAVPSLLSGLLPSLTGLAGGVGGGGALPLGTVDGLLGQLTAVLAGGLPAGAGGLTVLTEVLRPVTTLLAGTGVAALPAVGPLLAQLTALEGSTSDPATKAAATAAIQAAARPTTTTPTTTTPATTTGAKPTTTTPTGTAASGSKAGLDASTLAALAAFAQALGAPKAPAVPAGAPVAVPAAEAGVPRSTIVSVGATAGRGRITVRVACPATAPATGCTVRPTLRIDGRTVRLSGSRAVAPGATQTLRATVPAALAKKLRRSGGRVVAGLQTVGSDAGAVSRTLRLTR